MNIEELRTFVAIVEAKSLVAASRRLHVTQSTVTARMNTLEAEVGQRLLNRSKAGAELTSAGFKFMRYAELMIQLWSQARQEISLPPGYSGICNIGVEFDLWTELTTRFVDEIQRDEWKIAASVWPAEQMQLNRWLGMGLIDIAFCYSPQAADNFSNRVILDDPIMLVSTLGTHAIVPGPGYIYVDHGESFRRQHAEAYPQFTAGLVIASSGWALDHILRHGGSGFLPARMTKPLIDQGHIIAVQEAPVFHRRVYLTENPSAAKRWPWFEAALARAFPYASKPLRGSEPETPLTHFEDDNAI